MQNVKRMRMSQRALSIFVFLIFASAVMVIFAKMFGHHFLPSTEWAAMTRYLSPLFGILFAGVLMVFMKMMTGFTGEVVRGWKLIGIGFMGFLTGMITVTGSIPMAARLVAGQQTQLVYVVKNASGRDNRCATPIKLQGLPIMFDALCGFGQDVQRSLTRGQTIIVTGKGTWMGVLPQGIVAMPSRNGDS